MFSIRFLICLHQQKPAREAAFYVLSRHLWPSVSCVTLLCVPRWRIHVLLLPVAELHKASVVENLPCFWGHAVSNNWKYLFNLGAVLPLL